MINCCTLHKPVTYFLITACLFFSFNVFGQRRGIGNPNIGQNVERQIQNIKNSSTGNQKDSLQRRDKNADSITISFHYLDSTRQYSIDSSVNDFTKRFPIPATNIFLGNLGNASRSILFLPRNTVGWDPGFHAFDVYKWTIEKVRFFNTTRPFSELGYMLGSKTEQIIDLLHTQNVKPNWNILFQYRLINSPGFFKSQNSHHNNYLLTSFYEGEKKRYHNYFVLLGNRLQSSENGGIKNDEDYLSNTAVYKDRFNIPTNLGGDAAFSRNFFDKGLTTGNRYREFTALLRQQYDIGQKDSIVTDSTIIPLFYPRLRVEHTLQFTTDKYRFIDYLPDSVYYKNDYDLDLNRVDTVSINDNWKQITNDVSLYQFPDAKNQQQFIKLGATFQNLSGEFVNHDDKRSFYNLILHGEYRNKTRNRKWDFELFGKLFSAGLNSGDYMAYINLKRFVGKKNDSYAELGFENLNQSPPFIYDSRSSFYLGSLKDFKKQNISHAFASFFPSSIGVKLTGDVYFITNYLYFSHFNQPDQFSSLFNVIRVSAQKLFRLTRKINWYTDVYVQQRTGSAPVNLPLVFTRNRFAFEGVFFKNLNLSTGLEIKYHTPYKADHYSPVLGQFFFQDSITIRNFPDVSAFVHFGIRSFKAFVRFENLNTMQITRGGGFGWTNNNLAAPGYPYPGLQFRLGIWWGFVN